MCVCVCVCVCIVWISEQTAIISLYMNGLVFITGTECVSCPLATESLNIIKFNHSL